MLPPDAKSTACVVTVDAVQRAIEGLASGRSHEHLPGYLALLRRRLLPKYAFMGMRDIEEFHAEHLSFPDAPPGSPYLRPFLSRGRGARLLNRNLQGSYAPSSIRRGKPFSRIVQLKPVQLDDGRTSDVKYALVPEHAHRVLTEMLLGHKIPAVSLALFLFRDRRLCLAEPTAAGLLAALRRFFSIEPGHQEGEYIFSTLFENDQAHYDNRELTSGGQSMGACDDEEAAAMVCDERSREVTLNELGLGSLAKQVRTTPEAAPLGDDPELDSDDGILSQVQEARELGFAGVILSGPPGTGKSWYAQQIGVALAGQWDSVRSVQFHPSYQYEDFVVGYAPRKDGSFELQEKEFARICRDAAATPETEYVLVIDEMSRTDVVRVFGEALTYIATDRREQPFILASGEELAVPKNLFIIGTMNSWDKGVDELDIALERRFAEIAISPDSAVLRRLLERKGARSLRRRNQDATIVGELSDEGT